MPDSKTMADITPARHATVRMPAAVLRTWAAGGMGGGMGGGGMGGGWRRWQAAAGWAVAAWAAGMGGGMMGDGRQCSCIINRVVVPGPRQVLLHVKIAELNRTGHPPAGDQLARHEGQVDHRLDRSAGSAAVTGTAEATHVTVSGQPDRIPPPVDVDLFDAAGNADQRRPRSSASSTPAISRSSSTPCGNNRLAKILAEPNLVALDGQPARFLVGGQFPFPVPQSSSIPGGTAVVTIQFQRFGTILNFLPEILPNDVIRLDVEPVFSQLNFAQGTTVNGGRCRRSTERSARTVVELREGQTLAIAGLLQLTTNAATVADSRARRPADRRALVQQQPRSQTIETETDHPGDARAGRAAGEATR